MRIKPGWVNQRSDYVDEVLPVGAFPVAAHEFDNLPTVLNDDPSHLKL